MSRQQGIEGDESYRPRGYCPHCGYRMDPGECPECGRVATERQLDRRPFAGRHRRWARRVAIVTSIVAIAVVGWYCWGGLIPPVWRVVPTQIVLIAYSQGCQGAGAELVMRFERGALSRSQADAFFQHALSIPVESITVSTDDGEIRIPLIVGIPRAMRPRWSVHVVSWHVTADGVALATADGKNVHIGNVPLQQNTFRLSRLDRLSGIKELQIKLQIELHRSSMVANSGAPPLHTWNVVLNPAIR
jgi:hypothetical protein